MSPPRLASGDTIYVMYALWIGHHYCMSMLACQYNQPQPHSGLVTLTFDLERVVRVTCDVGYLCANFGLPRPLFST